MKVDVQVEGRFVGYTVSFTSESDRSSYQNRGWKLTRSRVTQWLEEQWAIAVRWDESAERLTTTT